MSSKAKVLTVLAVIALVAAVPPIVAAGPPPGKGPVNSASGRVGWWSASGDMWDVPGECYTTVKFKLYDYPRDEDGTILGDARSGSMTILVGSAAGRGDYRKYEFDLQWMDIIDRYSSGLLVASADMVCTKDTLYTGSEDSRVGQRMVVTALENGDRRMNLKWDAVEGGISDVQYGHWRFRIHTDYTSF